MAYLSSDLYEFILSPPLSSSLKLSFMLNISLPLSNVSSSVVDILSKSLKSPETLPSLPLRSFGFDLLDQSLFLWPLLASVDASASDSATALLDDSVLDYALVSAIFLWNFSAVSFYLSFGISSRLSSVFCSSLDSSFSLSFSTPFSV